MCNTDSLLGKATGNYDNLGMAKTRLVEMSNTVVTMAEMDRGGSTLERLVELE